MPIFWFENGKILAAGEIFTFSTLSGSVDQLDFIWNSKIGYPNLEVSQILTYFPWIIGKKIGLNNEYAIKMVWFIPYILKPISFMVMCYLFFSGYKRWFYSAIIGATLYCLNPFELVMNMGINRAYFMAAFPLIIGLYYKLIINKKFDIFLLLLICTASLLLSPSGGNPPVTSSLILGLLLVFIYFKGFEKKNLLNNIILILGLLTTNLFWIIGVYLYFKNLAENISIVNHISNWNSLSEGNLVESFRLLGSWAFKIKVYFPYFDIYYGIELRQFITYLPILIVILTRLIIDSNHLKKIYNFFVILLLICLFLSKGSNPPFGEFYEFFYNNIEFAKAWRSPWAKFMDGVVLSYSSIICIAFVHLYSKYNSKYVDIVLFISIITLSFSVSPILKGEAVMPSIYRESQIQIPEYWNAYTSWADSHIAYSERILLYPETDSTNIYDWEHGARSSSNFATIISKKIYLSHTPQSAVNTEYNRRINDLYDILGKKIVNVRDKVSAENIFKQFNLKYIIFTDDIGYDSLIEEKRIYSHDIYYRRLNAEENIKNFGFELANVFDNKIFVYKSNLKNKIKDFENVIGFNEELIKINETKYILPIINEETIINKTIVLNQNYDVNWTINLGYDNCNKPTIELSNKNLRYLNIFNSWEINEHEISMYKKSHFNDCDNKPIIYIEYKIQKYFTFFRSITLLIVIVTLVFSGFKFIKKYHEN